MNENDFKDPIRENLVRIRIYTWLGLKQEVEHIFKDLKDGYGLSEKFINQISFPSHMLYQGYTILLYIFFFLDLIGHSYLYMNYHY